MTDLESYKQKLKAAIENYNKSTKGSERAWEDFIKFVQTPGLCESQLKLISALEVYEDADFYKLGSGIPSFSIEFGELIDHSESSIAACEDTGEVARQALDALVRGEG